MSEDGERLHPAEQYAHDCQSGAVVASELVKLTTLRHINDRKRSEANDPDFPYYFDEESGQYVIDFIETFCCHSVGEWAGQPFLLEPWQKFIIWCLFGWKKQSDGNRRFKTAMIHIARKAGKTQLLAAIGLYLLIADGEPAAEIYSAATKKDQARILFDESRRMVMASPHLKALVQSFRGNMNVPETHAKFEPLSSDENTLDGLRVHGALIDELHSHKTRHVYDVLETATASRRQPLVVCITTSGFPFPDSICLELLGYGERILKGIIKDETFFTISFSLDPDDQWDDEKVWVKANPNLGVSVKLDDLRSKATKARETPSAQNNFKTKHLNIWCNSRSRWIPVERWDACREDYAVQELIGKECYAGLDLSTTTDISSLVLVFPWEDGKYRVLPFYWVPLENADLRARRDRVPYPLWIEQGHVFGTPGNAIDYGFIRKKIVELSSLYKVREIAADPWNATQILQQLREEDGLPVVEMRQGFASMSSPMKSLEALVMSQRLRHTGCPVLRWMMDNVSVRMDPAGNIKPDKEKSAERIDGVVALIMGVGRAELRKAPASNPYESGGVFSL